MSNNLMTIPLCQLKRAHLNVRKTGRKADMEALVASIEAHGLLENLIVRPSGGDEGEEAPSYEVVAGGRRLEALRRLARKGKLADDFPVPCRLLDKGESGDLVEASLAENLIRSALHPADQFEAFARLAREGLSTGDIAARFGLAKRAVEERLKLASVSPRLMSVYRAGDMVLEQLMAFTISDDHEMQEAVWFDAPHGDKSPRSIKRLLTRAHVPAGDRRALFIGLKAYEKAGGIVIRDLFDPEGEGYLADSLLLDRMVGERLVEEAEKLKAEGWAWVETMVDLDYGRLRHFGRLKPEEIAPSEEETAALSALAERYDELVAALEEAPSEETDAELERVEAEIEAMESKQISWTAEIKARSGVILGLDEEGRLDFEMGLVAPAEGGEESSEPERETLPVKRETREGYPDALLADLSAYRTAALQEMLARDRRWALNVLLHRLASDIFYRKTGPALLNIRASMVDLGRASKSVGESRAAGALFARHTAYEERMPPHEDLLSWIAALEIEEEIELLAYCVAVTIDATHRREGFERTRLEEADRLAEILSLDMADWWKATRITLFDHLTKGEILKAVAEGVSAETAKGLALLKKSEMGTRAEELLANGRWLPEPLRVKERTSADAEIAPETAAE